MGYAIKSDLKRSVVGAALVLASSFIAPAALAATATANATVTGIGVGTDGTASVTFTELDILAALGDATGGVLSGDSDSTTVSNSVGPFGQGAAANAGAGAGLTSASFAGATVVNPGESANANAETSAILPFELSGIGNVTFTINFDLVAFAFDSSPFGIANAAVLAGTALAGDPEFASVSADGTIGEASPLNSSLVLSFFFDEGVAGGPLLQELLVSTSASGAASVAAAPIPLPSGIWLLGSAALALLQIHRRERG